MLVSSKAELAKLTPPPLCHEFEKEDKEAAIEKWKERREKVTENVPPTAEPGTVLLNQNPFSLQDVIELFYSQIYSSRVHYIIRSLFLYLILASQEPSAPSIATATRKAPTCRTCGNPRKGHKNVDCPKNR